MSGSITSAASAASGTSGTTATGSAISQTGTTALSSLTANFSSFLSLLMTQLQNQDPTTPLDSNQFTSELVQFTGVSQQITTNSDLSQLIQLNQASQVEQSAAMIGKPATVTSSQLALQQGSGQINFNTTAAEPVAIAVYNASGNQIQGVTETSTAGKNTWQWNGQNAAGITQPDGPYTVTVTAVGSSGANATVPFTVTGTVTSVTNSSGTVDLQMGGLTVPFSSVVSAGS